MTTDTLIANYGLLAVFLGGLLEGETVFILAAVAAHHGLLSLPAVFVVGSAGAFLGDQAWFMLARHRSALALVRHVATKPRVRRALDFIERHPTVFVLSFRFVYGLRTAGAVACGLSNIASTRFLFFNFVAALFWTAVILALGYGFGSAMEAVLGEIKRIEWKILAASGALALLFIVIRQVQKKWQR
ncbi:MAG: DedA family protein [Hyphomicrobiales bacterium]|nr:DedA family protein [Hyphomicrobiales bacterium]